EASGAREARRQGPGTVSRRSQHGPRDVRVGRHRRLSGSGVRRSQPGRPAPCGAVMLQRLPFDGAVDADGHILDPPDLWDRYLEPAYRDRPMGIRKDADGLEYLEIAGRPSKMVRRGLPAGLAAMDLIGNSPRPHPPRTGPDYHRATRLAEEFGLPIGIHPTFEPPGAAPGRLGRLTGASRAFLSSVTSADAVRHGCTSMFQVGVFENCPRLKLVVLESGAGW